MLADALAPHNGMVIWRAFVYDMKPGYDRAGAAYENLQPFDGRFAANVLLQVKNGPIDFQPREPFHPLFGAMPKTQLMPELQITQEYLGFSNHLVFLASMWREVLDSDTYAKGPGSTVAKVADGSLYEQRLTGIAGVANTGSDRNWTGHHFLQANWYAFGRLAWNPDLTSRHIADEWIRMTFTREPKVAGTIARIMLGSHEALALHYQRGVDWVRTSRKEWDGLAGAIDPERHGEVAKKLAIQERDAIWFVLLCGSSFLAAREQRSTKSHERTRTRSQQCRKPNEK